MQADIVVVLRRIQEVVEARNARKATEENQKKEKEDHGKCNGTGS